MGTTLYLEYEDTLSRAQVFEKCLLTPEEKTGSTKREGSLMRKYGSGSKAKEPLIISSQDIHDIGRLGILG